MDQKLVKININIGGRLFPLKVTAQEALQVAAIEKKINEDIRSFQVAYPDKDSIDWLSMTLLKLAFETHETSSTSIVDSVRQLHKLLSNVVDA